MSNAPGPLPPADVLAILGNINGSNEAKLALLERRLTIHVSPACSREECVPPSVTSNQHSVTSCQSLPGFARENTPGTTRDTWQIQDIRAGERKRRRSLSGTGPSSPGHAPRPSLSPFLQAPPSGDANSVPAPPGDSTAVAGTPPSMKKPRNTINRYFAATGGVEAASGNPPPDVSSTEAERRIAVAASALSAAEEHITDCRRRLETKSQEVMRLQKENRKLEEELQSAKETSSSNRAESDARVRALLIRLATALHREESAARDARLAGLAPRLGAPCVRRRGLDVVESWEDGSAMRTIKAQQAELSERREAIEAVRKAAKRRLPLPGQAVPEAVLFGGSADPNAPLHPDDWVMQEEALKARLAAIKREEDGIKAEAVRVEAEMMNYVREVKLARDELASRFSKQPVLHNRYLLLNMLGRGGFSEVFRALDLQSHEEVAVKIHALRREWGEAKKASYVKHSVREYHIHRTLHHPRIVSLLDIFEIDANSFATVLELCPGGDLDAYCRAHESLPEREARAVTAQILAGLNYLASRPAPVIHYDLKPANVLFDATGAVRITDFGLSKVMEPDAGSALELTSQGAGTYWYLPPECFDQRTTPRISNKVDVWSLGIVLFQMLFGRRPFGHDQSQEQILRNEVIVNAREVTFPARPAVSAECKDFIRRCLAYRQEDRLDVVGCTTHPFMCFRSKDKKAPKDAAA